MLESVKASNEAGAQASRNVAASACSKRTEGQSEVPGKLSGEQALNVRVLVVGLRGESALHAAPQNGGEVTGQRVGWGGEPGEGESGR